MAEFVEGDWKDFTFKMIKPEHYPQVLDHLRRNFYVDEPLNKYLGQGEAKTRDMDKIGTIYMEQGISFMAIHKPTGKVAAARVIGIANKGDNLGEFLKTFESQEFMDLGPSFEELLTQGNLCERYGVNQYGDFLFMSVDKEFRGQGLAQEMYKRCFQLLQSMNIKLAESVFTNPISQKIARDLGFVEVYRKRLLDYRAEDGRQVLPNASEDEVAILMAKEL